MNFKDKLKKVIVEIKNNLSYKYDFYYDGKLKLLFNLFGIKTKSINASMFSQFNQDLIVKQILETNFKINLNYSGQDVRIVDIGANHPIDYNNTYLFEKLYGAKVYSFEPNKNLEREWIKYRSESQIQYVGISDEAKTLSLNIPEINNSNNDDSHDPNMFASFSESTIEKKSSIYNKLVVDVKPLENVLEKGNYDVLFIDVEGHEMHVLKGIDFDGFSFKVIVIENNSEVGGSDLIRKYLISRGYQLHSRLYHLDDIFIKSN